MKRSPMPPPQGVTLRRTPLKKRRKPKAKTIKPDVFALLPKGAVYRNKRYTDWVKSLPSCISGLPADDPHHLIGHGQGGAGTKSSDLYAIPLTRAEHDALHISWRAWELCHDSQWRYVAETLQRAILEGFKF